MVAPSQVLKALKKQKVVEWPENRYNIIKEALHLLHYLRGMEATKMALQPPSSSYTAAANALKNRFTEIKQVPPNPLPLAVLHPIICPRP